MLNLALLGYFKYTDFFISNMNAVLATNVPMQNIVLPLAISFFTFQQIAYLVDSYRGQTKKYSLLNYLIFVTFFPQLIAGPIVHHKEMMPQFYAAKNLLHNYRFIALGLFIFSIGLAKKIILADTFSIWATAGFDGQQALGFYAGWATSLSYTFQLYFDFSGYTDMAIGAALMFNIRLPINFNSPYKATDIQDFWRRWHMTLSRFLRDYVYIPLGGNRIGPYRTYFNLFATFLLGGIWHGASWMFVTWGALHGAALIVHRLWHKLGLRMWRWLAWCVTFLFINITWVFFRATDMQSATRVLGAMANLPEALNKYTLLGPQLATGNNIDPIAMRFSESMLANLLPFFAIFAALFIISRRNSIQICRLTDAEPLSVGWRHIVVGSVLFATAMLMSIAAPSQVFLYFNF